MTQCPNRSAEAVAQGSIGATTFGRGSVAALGALTALGAFTSDIVVPGVADIGASFGASQQQSALIVTLYLVGYGPGQFLWGTLTDRFGRRPTLLCGLILFVLSSIGCAFATSFGQLLALRCLQGVAVGCGPSIARAIVRDIGEGRRGASLMATMTAVLGVAPLFAPLLGAGLLVAFAWQAMFWFLALAGTAILLTAVVLLPETLAAPDTEALRPARLWRKVVFLGRQSEFRFGFAVVCIIYGGYAALLGLGALVGAQSYGIPGERFGVIFTIAASAFIAGALLARRLVNNGGILLATRLGGFAAGASGLALAAITFQEPEFWVLWAVVSAYVFSFGMLLPVATARALEPAGEFAGFASSLLGACMVLGGAAGSALAAQLFDGSHRALCTVMAAAALAVFAICVSSRRPTETAT